MGKSRILWILWLILAGIYWFFVDDYSGSFLLAVSVAVPLLFGGLTRHASGKLKLSVRTESEGEKNQPVNGRVTARNHGIFPLDRVICRFLCENLLTGERFFPRVRLAAPPRLPIERNFTLSSGHCGRIRLGAVEAVVYDPFGIFRFRVPVEAETAALIRPQTFGLEVQVAYGESLSLDSEEYSMNRAGSDPSETFAVREYREGDRVRQIHWKLSEKLENLMVRDYGLPIQNTILLLLETGILPGEERADAACIDALAEAMLSVSEELLEQQVVHSVGWQNHEENSFACLEVSTLEELTGCLPSLLCAAPGEDPVSVLGHYLEGHEQCEFAHVVLFTPHPIGDLAAIENQCLVTEILCEPGGGGGYLGDGSHRISASPESMAEDLAYLEI